MHLRRRSVTVGRKKLFWTGRGKNILLWPFSIFENEWKCSYSMPKEKSLIKANVLYFNVDLINTHVLFFWLVEWNFNFQKSEMMFWECKTGACRYDAGFDPSLGLWKQEWLVFHIVRVSKGVWIQPRVSSNPSAGKLVLIKAFLFKFYLFIYGLGFSSCLNLCHVERY